MVTPGVKGQPRRLRWVAVGQALLWATIALGAFLLLAKSVQNSSLFGRLQLWILIVDVGGVIALTVLLTRKLWRLVRDYRAHVPGSRLTARTVGDLRRAGDRAAADRVPVVARVHQRRHRQLVQGRGEAGPDRCARLIARGARSAHARVLDAHPGAGGLPARRPRRPTCRRGSMRSGAPRRRSRWCCSASTSASSPRVWRIRSRTCRRSRRRTWCSQVGQHVPYVSLEPQAGGRYLIRTAAALDDRAGARPGALRGRDLPGAGAARGAVGGSAELVLAVRRSRRAARAAQVQLPAHPHAGAAARDAGGDLRRDLLRAAPGAPGAGSDRGHARGRQGRLRRRACRCPRATRWASWCTPSTT